MCAKQQLSKIADTYQVSWIKGHFFSSKKPASFLALQSSSKSVGPEI